MKWFILILVLISYPIAELSRYILAVKPPLMFWELVLMWLAFIVGVIILAWRIK